MGFLENKVGIIKGDPFYYCDACGRACSRGCTNSCEGNQSNYIPWPN